MLTALLPLLLSLPVTAAPKPVVVVDDRFFPDEGPERVSYGELLREGSILGRSGRLLLGSADPQALLAHPDVEGIEAHAGGLLVLTPRPGVDDLALARALHADPRVEWVHPDLILPLRPLSTPNDPFYGDQWHLDNTGQGGRTPGVDVGAPRAWERATGAGVLIAVLDTGLVLDHPDLRAIAGHDYLDGDDDPSPDMSDPGSAPHGTCAAGVAAAIGDNGLGVAGVAWGAEVYGVRLIGEGGSGLEGIYDAFIESVDAGAGVLSNSWGWSDGCPDVPNYRSLREMFAYAEEQGRGGLGAVVVFAAGNGACDIKDDGMLSNESLVVVSAIESDDRRASYSSYGDFVDLAAPTSILTTDVVTDGYGSYGGEAAFVDGFSGTSASTPVVAGVAALMIEANPRITAAQLRLALCDTAVRNDVANADWDAEGRSPWYGCGRVDAGAAVDAVANSAPAAPVLTLVSEEVPVGQVFLSWEPALDADGDVYAYELAWWREGEDEALAPTELLSETELDLSAELALEDRVSYKVRALDPWGASEWSAVVSFTVVERAMVSDGEPAADSGAPDSGAAGAQPDTDTVTQPGEGCSQRPGEPLSIPILGALLALGLRRRAPIGAASLSGSASLRAATGSRGGARSPTP